MANLVGSIEQIEDMARLASIAIAETSFNLSLKV